jgi:hypothetical protein
MKKTKIIFLDIDGVLATNKQFQMSRKKFQEKNKWAYEDNVPYPFDKKCVKILNEILNETDAEIVLTSDWKFHWDLIRLHNIFENNGVIKSPRMVTKNNPISFGNFTKNRANEIDIFLKHFQFANYVVIDDLNVGHYLELGNDKVVLTNRNEGLKQIGIKDKIIKILTHDYLESNH